MKANWEEILKDRLQLYGHRNWLVIADSAYPAQSRPAIETIVADEEQTTSAGTHVCNSRRMQAHQTQHLYRRGIGLRS